MNRIDRAFKRLRKDDSAAFIPFIATGDPDLDMTRELILELERRGADVLELGCPYSDPIADGPTIQAAFNRALDGGAHVADLFKVMKDVRAAGCELAVTAMISYTLVYKMGVERFLDRAAEAGIDGLTVPDLSVDLSDDLFDLLAVHQFVDELEVLRQDLIEQDATRRGLDDLPVHPHPDGTVQIDLVMIVGHQRLPRRGERPSLSASPREELGHVVAPHRDILRLIDHHRRTV